MQKNRENSAFERIKTYLASAQNIITNIYPVETYNDYPQFYHYLAEYANFSNDNEVDILSNGIDVDRQTALVKTVMETIERWYLVEGHVSDVITGSYRNLSKTDAPVLSPHRISPFSEEQKKNSRYQRFRFLDTTKTQWIKMEDAISGKNCYLPQSLVMFPKQSSVNQPTGYMINSSGAAAGMSQEQAIYRAICELIERDAYMIMFYNRLALPKIGLNTFSGTVGNLIDTLHRYLFDVHLFKMTLDIDIPIVLCLLVDKTDKGPKITVGAKCDLSWSTACYGAIMEAVQSLSGLRDMWLWKQGLPERTFLKFHQSFSMNKPIYDRMIHFLEPSSMLELNFLLKSKTKAHIDPSLKSDRPQTLHPVLRLLKKSKIKNLFWKKVSPKALDRYGIYSVRVVVPDLVPFSISYDFPHFGHRRVFEVPVKTGYLKEERTAPDLNNLPHPLP